MKKDTHDMLYEGRDEAYLDIDRMINEGLAGGTVHMSRDHTNIEEARDLVAEEKPHTTQ